MINCLLTGVGGQGILLASKLLATTYMEKEKMVRIADTIGMAQRGGSVVCHIRAGDIIYSPLIPIKSADILMGFEPAETVRRLPYLKKDGYIITSTNPINPSYNSINDYNSLALIDYLENNYTNIVKVDVNSITRECKSSKVINIIIIGVAIGCNALNISFEDMKDAMKLIIPQKYLAINEYALEIAYSLTSKKKPSTYFTHYTSSRRNIIN
ncbi:indolepyruvate oxidoreductase subunit beta [Vallitalea sp.]|jgi:indolepyruvate ferredoxin oxidoreductase beta subunit|uniref:indolepyruvate oxidoreductase subunit beta n=1 Tax=Vallitalea sp. TaxID=1882829 RepID=UPI0025F2C5CC|nr:indolepyruvate oxidoreductase subunit beta [Vallitalea sp.]MCT4686720.1 indolepyruvate oxidoreductase subunit beta [Vallitalea sp.]